MIEDPWAWISDIVYTIIYVAGAVVIGVILLMFTVYFTGFYKYLF